MSKIREDAIFCYNGVGKKGSCSGSYDNGNKVCAYCLEYLCRKPNSNKKEGSDISLTDMLDKAKKDTSNSVIEKSKTKVKTFRFPIDLIEFPLNKNDKNPTEVEYRNKIYIVEDLKSLYGSYQIRTVRNHKPMDTKILLATLYFTDYFKNKNQFENKTFENKFIEWLDLLDIKDIPYYRKAIIEGLDFLENTTLYHYHAWNYKKGIRETFKKGGGLPSFSVFHILDEYHHLTEKHKRKSKLKVKVGETFYNKIQERYTYIDIEKVLPLSDIALNLYMFLKKQYDKSTFVKIPYPFELFRYHIGITDKNITYAKRTFERAFKNLKDEGLIKEYDYDIKVSDNTDSITFKFIKSLTSEPVNNF